MNNKVSRLSLSLSQYRERRQGAGLSFLPPSRLPKGGLRKSEKSDRLSDFIWEVTP